MLAYSARHRFACIRIPYAVDPMKRRIEVRFPDATGNPYLAFSAILMAGLDGVLNKIQPGEPMDDKRYEVSSEQGAKLPKVCASLEEALEALDQDRAFLKAGGVFTDNFIDSYIQLKMEDVTRLRRTPHPIEFDMYYSV
jgi:glutamine synthetase